MPILKVLTKVVEISMIKREQQIIFDWPNFMVELVLFEELEIHAFINDIRVYLTIIR